MQIAGFTFVAPRPSRLAVVVFFAGLTWALGVQLGVYGSAAVNQSSGLVAQLVGFSLIACGVHLVDHWKLFVLYVAIVAAGVFIWRALFSLFS